MGEGRLDQQQVFPELPSYIKKFVSFLLKTNFFSYIEKVCFISLRLLQNDSYNGVLLTDLKRQTSLKNNKMTDPGCSGAASERR